MRFTVIMEDGGKAAKASFDAPHGDLNIVMPLIRQAVVALIASTQRDDVSLENKEAESNGLR